MANPALTGRTIYNKILAVLNLITAALSIPIVVSGILLAKRHHTDCLSFLQWPVIVVGIVMFVTSVIGFVGTLRRIGRLLLIYLCILFLIILVLLAFTIFAFTVTSKGGGHKVAGARFKEYRLSDFSDWLQDQVNEVSVWEKLKRCIQDRHICSNLNADYPSRSDFYNAKLSYVQSGCCKPPTTCGFNFTAATNWASPTNKFADLDCSRWSNDEDELCYECNSCRAGVLRTVKKDWEKVAIIDIAVLVLLTIVYVMSWVAFMNAMREKLLSRGGPYEP